MFSAVLLTGGAGKFGKAISTYLVSLDWKVVITCRDASEIGAENPAFNNIKDQIKIFGSRFREQQCCRTNSFKFRG